MNEHKKIGVGFGVMIKDGSKVLLGLRSGDPTKTAFREDSTWTFPGGKMHFGESFQQGAKREVLEETSIEIEDMEVVGLQNNVNEHAHFVTLCFLANEWRGEPKIMEPDEIVEWKWFDLDKLPDNLYTPTRKFISQYKAGVFCEEEK
ncbi:MAG: NUDIX domain-containing protein [Candidatus Nomurabacteria bacterium]|jgi:ADP-ribose pyrophosphatase YjhB (NUDIX family)|nr:NUDIX domain-containing protein [Candidatus Nomurabacteria bacterium]